MTNEDRAREIVERKTIGMPDPRSRAVLCPSEGLTAAIAAALDAAEERGCRWGIEAAIERSATACERTFEHRTGSNDDNAANVCAKVIRGMGVDPAAVVATRKGVLTKEES